MLTTGSAGLQRAFKVTEALSLPLVVWGPSWYLIKGWPGSGERDGCPLDMDTCLLSLAIGCHGGCC